MSSITPWVSPMRNAVRYAAATTPYGRAAYSVYANRGNLAKAGKLAKFIYQRRSKFKQYAAKMRKNQVNTGRGMGAAKKTQLSNNIPQLQNSRELLFQELTAINKTEIDIANNLAVTNLEINRINRRQRQIIFVRGFQIDQYVQNVSDSPLLYNMAVIQPINSTAVSTSGWFREYTESRDVDFSTGLGALQIHEYPISTDKYRVLLHKRYTLGPVASGTQFNTTGPPNFLRLKHYVKFNKQIRFNDDSTTFAEQRVYLVFWADNFNAPPGAVVKVNAYNVASRTTTVWDETMAPY